MLERVHDWLSDPLGLLDALSNPGDDTALAQTLLAAASARCRAWLSTRSQGPCNLSSLERSVDAHRPGEWPPQTGLKFEFSSLQQAVQFEISLSLAPSMPGVPSQTQHHSSG